MARENYSRKRVAILDKLASTKIHPTAEWVYQELKPEYNDLSLGTVYRNIKKFCQEGKVRSVGVINGQEHFDGDISNHSHFLCEKCGSIYDIYDNCISDEMNAHIETHYDLTVNSYDIIFNGVCSNCKRLENH